jgi:outer membrane receptor protein involved in Fe transport
LALAHTLQEERHLQKVEEVKPSNPIVVTATRTERPTTEVPASVTVIHADEIALRSVESPEALLKNEAGVDLAVSPGGGIDRIVLRAIPVGFSGNTTQYLLNGMPVDPMQIATNKTLWHLLSPVDIERIEVVRGPASALYGANAMGGVINIITKRGAGTPFTKLDIEGGSHHGRAAGWRGGGSFGDFDLRISARDKRSDGYRPILDSTWGGQDYDLSERESEGSHINGSLSYWPSEQQMIRMGVYHYEQRDDWLGGHPNQRSDSEGSCADFTYTHGFGDNNKVTSKLLALDNKYHVYSDNSYQDIPEDSLALTDRYEDHSRSINVEFQLDLQPTEGNTLILGTSYSYGTWELDGNNRYSDYPNWTPYSRNSKSRAAALFAQDEISLGKHLIFTLSGRYDRYRFEDIQLNKNDRPDSKDGVFTPRAGLRYRLNPTYSLYASAGKGYIPSIPILMYRGSNRWLDNVELEPERSTSWEVGLNFIDLNGGIEGSLALYHSKYQDRITSVQVNADGQPCTNKPCLLQYQNITAIQVEGIELILQGKISGRWHPFFNYTLTSAEIRENRYDPQTKGNAPAYTPRHKANLGLTYEDNQGFGARIAGRYVATRYWTEHHHDWSQLDNFFVVDAKLAQNFPLSGKLSGVEISLAVNNLFDQTYSEWNGELADGRNWWLGITAGL